MINSQRFLCLLIGGLLTTSCASNPSKSSREELLFNPVISGQTLEVSVLSNGCTEPSHFYLKVSDDLVELRRIKQDVCRAAPMLVRLAFTYSFGSHVYRFKNETRFSNRTLAR